MKVGVVTHYYDKIKVAIIDLTGSITTGDKVRFVRGGEDLFDQTVESLQIEHESVEKAGKGDVVGLKTKKEVKEGAQVLKLQKEKK